MLKQQLLLGKLFLVFLILFTACKKEKEKEPAPSETATGTASTEELAEFLARTTGHETKDVEYSDSSRLFTIDGDLLITRDEASKYFEKENKGARTTHYRGTYLVSNAYVTDIKVFINTSVPADWITATAHALTQWNAVTGTKLTFSRVYSSASANIVVNPGYEAGGSWVARAYLPLSDGRPGQSVEINTYYNSLTSAQKLFAMAHEIGHTFGLLHTNQTQGTFIAGTPASDANSVMNSYVLSWVGFTSGDIAAVRILYPENSFWQSLPGAAHDIGVSHNGSAWIIGTNAVPGGYGIYYWNGAGWTNISGGATNIAVSGAGVPWVVNNAGQIFRRNSGGSWDLLPGGAYDIAVAGTSNAWIIGTNAVGGGYGIYYWNGAGWTNVSGGAVRIAVSPSGIPWVVNNAGDIFYRSGGSWVNVPGKGRDIGIAGDGSVYLIGTGAVGGGYQIFKYNGGGWTLIDGGAVRISAGTNLPWVVNNAGNIFRRW